ncbi:MAG: hypothetical protein JWP84_4121 [Tardiphaga sp.]|nr:hypothetical protein [Tardiphaga sp.]
MPRNDHAGTETNISVESYWRAEWFSKEIEANQNQNNPGQQNQNPGQKPGQQQQGGGQKPGQQQQDPNRQGNPDQRDR